MRINTVSPGMTDTDLVADAAQTFDFSQERGRERVLAARRSPT